LDLYLAVKFLHIAGAAILLGTGLGIAFFLFMADRVGNIEALATTLRHVVIADYVFTATAAILQPVTGLALVHLGGGFSLDQTWIWASIVLYLLVGACWLPVIVLQTRMRDLADAALHSGQNLLPPLYHRLMRIWFALGWPAFLSVLAIFWLMVAKPT
jgi:uncharacterized membrane protein